MLIGTLALVHQQREDVDVERLWERRLPGLPADEAAVAAVERQLGMALDPAHRQFLLTADGWEHALQHIDVFGTADLVGGRMEAARQMVEAMGPAPFEAAGLDPGGVVPMAATAEDMDLFVMPVADGVAGPTVVWFAGGEVDRFADFADFMLAVLEYNRREVANLLP
ncbi:hypothetical protein BH23ACT9_BH23ACT9_28120 [soil metagenome]